jgi:hypothetical protein
MKRFLIVIIHLFIYKSTQQQCELSCKEQHCDVKTPKELTLARFEPTFFCSGGGGDNHCTTPAG